MKRFIKLLVNDENQQHEVQNFKMSITLHYFQLATLHSECKIISFILSTLSPFFLSAAIVKCCSSNHIAYYWIIIITFLWTKINLFIYIWRELMSMKKKLSLVLPLYLCFMCCICVITSSIFCMSFYLW